MMQRWANQKDEENERFPKRNNDKRNNGNRSHKSQQNYSEPSQKRKPDHEVATVERNSRGKKSGNQQVSSSLREDLAQAMFDAPKVQAHTLPVHQPLQVSQCTSP
jgi:hypothetical protein